MSYALKLLILVLLSALCVPAQTPAPDASGKPVVLQKNEAGQDDKAAVTRLLSDYARVFGKLDVQAILPYYLEPSMLIRPQGVAMMPTHAAMAATFAPLMEGLRVRGYARSEFTTLNMKRLSATTMLVSGVAVRYKADGQELERIGATYVLHKTEKGWKIAVSVRHDVENVVRLE